MPSSASCTRSSAGCRSPETRYAKRSSCSPQRAAKSVSPSARTPLTDEPSGADNAITPLRRDYRAQLLQSRHGPIARCAAGNLQCVPSPSRSVAVVTLGCARNEVDSEELAGRLNAGGWGLTDDTDDADVVLVNTCGFIESAKKDSIDTLLAAADTGKKVVAVGCLAERYGKDLAASLPEADAIVGFDSYAEISSVLDDVVAGRAIEPHAPRDRRTLLPITPIHRPAASIDVSLPGHAWLPAGNARSRLDDSPIAYLKIASGCDRRCTFCAIPSF